MKNQSTARDSSARFDALANAGLANVKPLVMHEGDGR